MNNNNKLINQNKMDKMITDTFKFKTKNKMNY